MGDIAFQTVDQEELEAGDPDDRIKAALLAAAKAMDPDAGIVTRYFTTVEYLDKDGNYGIFNIFPSEAPVWQVDGMITQGWSMWDQFLERIGATKVVGEDEGED